MNENEKKVSQGICIFVQQVLLSTASVFASTVTELAVVIIRSEESANIRR